MENDIYAHAQSLLNVKEEDVAIRVDHLTKDYGKGRGLFDVSFIVPKGKVFGYCGTNGAGKTTTLRHIMGFLKPDSGSVTVYGMDAWKSAPEIKKYIGYLPGEIAFPPLESGTEFLKFQAEMLGLNDMSRAEEIIKALQLDPTANLKRMSKGMKQKTALVATFMHRPEIVLLDEPTTGLDPLMRDAFINIIKQEKERGVTIVMSNHMFNELEETCDYVGFIRDGRLVDIVDMNALKERPAREFQIVYGNPRDFLEADWSYAEIIKKEENYPSLVVRVKNEDLNRMFADLNKAEIRLIREVQYSLEQYFMDNVIGGMK